MKSIIKEIIILLLLCLAICLVLIVIFYNYIPINETIPSKIEPYKASSTIKEEINEEIVEYQKQNVVFEITDSDLTLYKQTQSYNPGKSNPFTVETVNSTATDTTTTTPTSGDSNIDASKDNTKTGSQNYTNTFFEDTKLK